HNSARGIAAAWWKWWPPGNASPPSRTTNPTAERAGSQPGVLRRYMQNPDFFLASSESYQLMEPRSCKRIKQVHSDNRDDLLLVKVKPPLIGQLYGLGGRNIDTLLIATRHKGDSLFPIRKWPVS